MPRCGRSAACPEEQERKRLPMSDARPARVCASLCGAGDRTSALPACLGGLRIPADVSVRRFCARAAPLLQDGLQLVLGNLVDLELQEARAEGAAERLSSCIDPWGVLRREEHKVRVWLDSLLQLGHVQLAVVIEQSAHGRGGCAGGGEGQRRAGGRRGWRGVKEDERMR